MVSCKLSLPLWEYKYNNYASRFVTLAPWLIIQGDLGELDSRGRLRFCSLLECHLRDISGLL